jgi:SSS family solute:Na+ symporter
VMDFYRPFLRPAADERHYLRVSRLMTLVWGAVLILIALLATQFHRGVLVLALTIASVPYGSMLGIFLLGVLTRQANSRGALAGALLALAVLGFVLGFTSIAWTWYVAIGTVVTFVGGWVASLAMRREAGGIENSEF